MTGFEFSLQTKLDLTVMQEKMAKEELKLRQEVYDEESRRLRQLQEGMERLLGFARSCCGQSIKVYQVISLKDYQKVLRQAIEEQEGRVEAAFRLVEEARSILLELRRERRMLEKMRERQHQEYQRKALRQEQKVIDESALGLYQRRLMAKQESST